MATKAKPKRGRPKGTGKAAQERRSIVQSVRIHPDLKAELASAAKAAGHSIGAEISNRLRWSSAKRPAAWGGNHSHALAIIAARVATWVAALTGETWHKDRFTAEAVVTCLNNVMAHPALSPPPPPELPPRLARHIAELEAAGVAGLDAWKSQTDLGLACSLGVLRQLFTTPAPTHPSGEDAINDDLPHAGRLLGLRQSESGEIPLGDGKISLSEPTFKKGL